MNRITSTIFSITNFLKLLYNGLLFRRFRPFYNVILLRITRFEASRIPRENVQIEEIVPLTCFYFLF